MSINTTTRPSESKTVRMFDGEKWDTYKRGGKQHRAAEARRAAWEATRPSKDERDALKAARAVGNKAQAAWMREHGIVPSGSAWKAVSAGERGIKVLRAMNAADGLVFRAPTDRKAPKAAKAGKTAAKASKGTKAPVAEVTASKPEGTKADRKAAKRRSKAARKAYQTRLANGSVVRENGKFVKATPASEPVTAPVVETDAAESVRKGGKKALFFADLRDVGLTDAQIEAAWACRK